MRFLGSILLGACALAAVGCGGGDSATGVTSVYRVPASLDELAGDTFFDHPWPSDVRLDGRVPHLKGYPNPSQSPILDEYIDAVNPMLDGFSPAAAGYVRFTGAIDPGSLPPNPVDAAHPNASVQLVDVDPSSPEHGKRKLVSLYWRGQRGVYYPATTLAFMPSAGFPLRPHTRYAFVVTDAIKAADGSAVSAAPELSAVLGLSDPADAPQRAAHDLLVPAVAELAKIGLEPAHIVHLAVFTTGDPTAELFAFRDALRKNVPAPTASASAWRRNGSNADFDEYLGSYGPSPNFQAGNIPYANPSDGGGFYYDAQGAPAVANTFDLRFSLSVPNAQKCPMPAAGYPIVLYAHGTGGDYRSYIDDGTATSLTRRCLAAMGVDQIFHGTRPGSPLVTGTGDVEVLFFNFKNIVAARTNGRQSALDEVQRARLFTESKTSVPAAVSKGKGIRFDATKVLFFGHSQGGLNGPLYLAADDSARGGVLSGSGALLSIALLEKTEPSPSVAGLVATLLLGLDPASAENELSLFHPGISLAQTLVDVVDPIHYARWSVQEPRSGFAPKSLYMTEGINPDGTGDHYAPPHGIEAHAIGLGLPLQLPDEREPDDMAWGGPTPVSIPTGGLSGDLASGNASGVLAQWAVPAGDDGHFVVFDVPAATAQAAGFERNLADDANGRVPAP